MREHERGWIHAISLVIRAARQPIIMTRGRAIIVSNESADATNREQCGCDERPSLQNRRCLMTCLSKHVFRRHRPLLSFTRQIRREHSGNSTIKEDGYWYARAPVHQLELSPLRAPLV